MLALRGEPVEVGLKAAELGLQGRPPGVVLVRVGQPRGRGGGRIGTGIREGADRVERGEQLATGGLRVDRPAQRPECALDIDGRVVAEQVERRRPQPVGLRGELLGPLIVGRGSVQLLPHRFGVGEGGVGPLGALLPDRHGQTGGGS